MGQVDGSASRPGQLGDTGVIVLNICDEGKCDCKAVLAEAAAQKKAKKTTTVKPTSSSRGSSGGGFTRGGGSSRFTPFRSRTRYNSPCHHIRQIHHVFPISHIGQCLKSAPQEDLFYFAKLRYASCFTSCRDRFSMLNSSCLGISSGQHGS